jgi:hypothetical protein
MPFHAEQHLFAAKLVRKNGARRTGAEREFFIRKSNSFVACLRLSAKDRGGICLEKFAAALRASEAQPATVVCAGVVAAFIVINWPSS